MSDTMVERPVIRAIEVTDRLFGGPLRAGDLLAICNFLEFIREKENDPNMCWKLIPSLHLHKDSHIHTLYNFLCGHTNYFAGPLGIYDQLLKLPVISGTDPVQQDIYNIWNIRKDIIGPRRQNIFDIEDKVKIHNTETSFDSDIVVIAPVFDAQYNLERNWTMDLFKRILNSCPIYKTTILCSDSIKTYIENELEEFSCVPRPGVPRSEWEPAHFCTDYRDTLTYIMKASIYIGGDTGLSHFAGALDDDKTRIYYYSRNTYGTTNPLNWKKNGILNLYDDNQHVAKTFDKGIAK